MNRTRHARSSQNSISRNAEWGLSSALLVAFGTAATLFSALSLGLATGGSADQAARVIEASRASEPLQPTAGELEGEPSPTIAFVPRYSEAVRLSAYAAAGADRGEAGVGYPSRAGVAD